LNGQPGKRFFSTTHLLVVDRESLIVTPHQPHWDEETINKGQAETILGPFRLKMREVKEMEPGSDKGEAMLDAGLLTFPLRWRKWQAGDSFHPLGMDHKKKLSDFLIDNKISVADKEVVTVLESDGDIVWVVGHRIDDRYKITVTTTSILRFSLHSASS
jgi:tRNA(Ile)-lysidine synthase